MKGWSTDSFHGWKSLNGELCGTPLTTEETCRSHQYHPKKRSSRRNSYIWQPCSVCHLKTNTKKHWCLHNTVQSVTINKTWYDLFPSTYCVLLCHCLLTDLLRKPPTGLCWLKAKTKKKKISEPSLKVSSSLACSTHQLLILLALSLVWRVCCVKGSIRTNQ